MDPAQRVPAAFWPEDVLGRLVVDLSGHTVGRVTRCEPAGGPVERIDVVLTRRAARRLGQGHLEIAWSDLVSAGDEVVLRDDARYVAHPDEAPRES